MREFPIPVNCVWRCYRSVPPFGTALRECRHGGLARLGSLSGTLPPSPPSKKSTACQDQARQSGTDDGTGNKLKLTSNLAGRKLRSVDIKIAQSAYDSRDQRRLGRRDRIAVGGDERGIVEISAHKILSGLSDACGEEIRTEGFKLAHELLELNKAKLDTVAAHLIKHGQLSGADFATIMRGH
jgi:hypothetical protein